MCVMDRYVLHSKRSGEALSNSQATTFLLLRLHFPSTKQKYTLLANRLGIRRAVRHARHAQRTSAPVGMDALAPRLHEPRKHGATSPGRGYKDLALLGVLEKEQRPPQPSRVCRRRGPGTFPAANPTQVLAPLLPRPRNPASPRRAASLRQPTVPRPRAKYGRASALRRAKRGSGCAGRSPLANPAPRPPPPQAQPSMPRPRSSRRHGMARQVAVWACAPDGTSRGAQARERSRTRAVRRRRPRARKHGYRVRVCRGAPITMRFHSRS